MYKKYQLGRSMVEMLGVLAVIAVLSVGGVAGYKTAMKQHMHNRISHFLQQLSLILVAESHKEEADDLRCTVSSHYSYNQTNYVCQYLDKQYCQGKKISYNGYYWIDNGNDGPYFGWQLLNIESKPIGLQLELWMSDTDMCTHVMNTLRSDSDFVELVRKFSYTYGYNGNVGGWHVKALWTDAQIAQFCKPSTKDYYSRYPITVGFVLKKPIPFDCEEVEE